MRNGAGVSMADGAGSRRTRLARRGGFAVLALIVGWSLAPPSGEAQPRHRACPLLQTALARVGAREPARQVVTARMERLGCASSATSTRVPATTTTTVPPGGATTTALPATTTTMPPPPTTTLPGAPTTGPTTTRPLPPCGTTTTGQFVPTTVPCIP